MARTYKVWIVIAVVLLTLNLVYSFSIYDLLFPRPRFPSRENVKKRLRMMLPLDESNTWNGYDDEGFTRNGRSLKHSNLGLDISQAMWPWPLDFAAERGRQTISAPGNLSIRNVEEECLTAASGSRGSQVQKISKRLPEQIICHDKSLPSGNV